MRKLDINDYFKHDKPTDKFITNFTSQDNQGIIKQMLATVGFGIDNSKIKLVNMITFQDNTFEIVDLKYVANRELITMIYDNVEYGAYLADELTKYILNGKIEITRTGVLKFAGNENDLNYSFGILIESIANDFDDYLNSEEYRNKKTQEHAILTSVDIINSEYKKDMLEFVDNFKSEEKIVKEIVTTDNVINDKPFNVDVDVFKEFGKSIEGKLDDDTKGVDLDNTVAIKGTFKERKNWKLPARNRTPFNKKIIKHKSVSILNTPEFNDLFSDVTSPSNPRNKNLSINAEYLNHLVYLRSNVIETKFNPENYSNLVFPLDIVHRDIKHFGDDNTVRYFTLNTFKYVGELPEGAEIDRNLLKMEFVMLEEGFIDWALDDVDDDFVSQSTTHKTIFYTEEQVDKNLTNFRKIFEYLCNSTGSVNSEWVHESQSILYEKIANTPIDFKYGPYYYPIGVYTFLDSLRAHFIDNYNSRSISNTASTLFAGRVVSDVCINEQNVKSIDVFTINNFLNAKYNQKHTNIQLKDINTVESIFLGVSEKKSEEKGKIVEISQEQRDNTFKEVLKFLDGEYKEFQNYSNFCTNTTKIYSNDYWFSNSTMIGESFKLGE